MADRFELSVRNASALATNFARLSADARRRVLDVVRESGERVLARTLERVPRDTGFMAEHTRLDFSPQGFTYEVGWSVLDFVDAGLAFYAFFVEEGTRYQPAQPSLRPAYEEETPRFRRELRDAVRGALQAGGR